MHSDGELHRFATQRHQTQKETQELNKIDQSGSLMLTLFDTKCLSALDQQLEISLSHIFPMVKTESEEKASIREKKNFPMPKLRMSFLSKKDKWKLTHQPNLY